MAVTNNASDIIKMIEKNYSAPCFERIFGLCLDFKSMKEYEVLENEINSALFEKGIFAFIEEYESDDEEEEDSSKQKEEKIVQLKCAKNDKITESVMGSNDNRKFIKTRISLNYWEYSLIESYDDYTKSCYTERVEKIVKGCLENSDPNLKKLPPLVGFLCCFAEYEAKLNLAKKEIILLKNKSTGNLECIKNSTKQ